MLRWKCNGEFWVYSAIEDSTKVDPTACIKRSPTGDVWISYLGQTYQLSPAEFERIESSSALDLMIRSPMTGLLKELKVAELELVKEQQSVAVLEAMKMQIPLVSKRRARVKKIHAVVGELVNEGQLICELEEPS